MTKGQRVKIHPASDFFMMGERYAIVQKTVKRGVWVRGERSGKRYLISPSNLTHASFLYG